MEDNLFQERDDLNVYPTGHGTFLPRDRSPVRLIGVFVFHLVESPRSILETKKTS